MDMKNWIFVFSAAVLIAATAHAGLEPDISPSDTIATPTVVTPAMPECPDTAAVIEEQAPTSVATRHRAFGTFAAFGKSDGKVLAAVIGADYHFDNQWQLGDHGQVTPYAELELSYWEGKKGHTGVSSLHEAGLLAFGRYCYLRSPHATVRPYAEIGMGVHYLTENKIEGKELGRNWLASSNIGAGLVFGRDERFEIGLRIRHLSNAGTDDLNWGINQILGRIALRF